MNTEWGGTECIHEETKSRKVQMSQCAGFTRVKVELHIMCHDTFGHIWLMFLYYISLIDCRFSASGQAAPGFRDQGRALRPLCLNSSSEEQTERRRWRNLQVGFNSELYSMTFSTSVKLLGLVKDSLVNNISRRLWLFCSLVACNGSYFFHIGFYGRIYSNSRYQ